MRSKFGVCTTSWSFPGPSVLAYALAMRPQSSAKTKTMLGRGASLAVTPASLPLQISLVVDSPTATTGQCGETVFPPAPPFPGCVLKGGGDRLACR